MNAAHDFHNECDQIAALLRDLSDTDFHRTTAFKGWTIGEIVEHLHLFNIAADEALKGEAAFQAFCAKILPVMPKGHQALQRDWFDETRPAQTFADWMAFYPGMVGRFADADPETRVKWFGPDMSVRSCIIARQMEHWAHAQAIYDVLGVERANSDRLKNVAHIGVTTYSWSFKVNGLEPPRPKPYVRLIAPSGAIWEWNAPQDDNRIDGPAEDFCQAVTQCRNIGDMDIALTLTGDTAKTWMRIAQCFAGPPETPPAVGTRRMEG
ncbi:TIGR03084 family metal-binding protein [Algimonas porphyrae]|uniref:TIGR03084 family protein n=1 Tax=Algimonas porphyrae TaxID=1128113 RepID=A0ABQ5V1D2_9PROT|nr:TIGR03084 family metal-binding protein [Algimonas porphyrae]GLQ21341.1 TIGR03084 family protein [Algimonas porphyrae]